MKYLGLFIAIALLYGCAVEYLGILREAKGTDFSVLRAIAKGTIFSVMITPIIYYNDRRKAKKKELDNGR